MAHPTPRGRGRPPPRRGLAWPLLAAILVGALLVVLGGRQLYYAWTVEVPAQGGRYVEAALVQPNALNPLLAHDSPADRPWLPLLFAGLTRVAPDGRVLPDLAERWETAADGRTYTFTLRPGLRWSDGSPLDASDVVFTYDALRDPAFPGDADALAIWRELRAEAPDLRTVRVILPQAWAAFPEAAALGIVPRAALQGTSGQAWLDQRFNLDPIGAGPYRLRDLSAVGASLTPNPHYHGPRPHLSELRLAFVADLTSAQAGLLGGTVEGLAAYAPLPAAPRTIVHQRPDYTRPVTLWLNTAAPPFDEPAVRLAVAHAIDRAALAAEVPGAGEPAHGPLPPSSWAASEAAFPGYAPDRARALLDGAGWRASGNGERRRNGQTLTVALTTNDDPARRRAAEVVAQGLRAAGVRVELGVRAWPELARDELAGRRFQALLLGSWTPRRDPDLLRDLWSGDGVANLSGWRSARADELLARGARAPDEPTRREAYAAFQALWAAELPSVPLYYPTYAWAAPTALRGVDPTALGGADQRLAQLPAWYLHTTRVWRGP